MNKKTATTTNFTAFNLSEKTVPSHDFTAHMVSYRVSHAIWYSNFCALFSVLLSRTALFWNTIFFFHSQFSIDYVFHLLICGADATMLSLSSSSSSYGKVIILSHYRCGIIGFFSLLISIYEQMVPIAWTSTQKAAAKWTCAREPPPTSVSTAVYMMVFAFPLRERKYTKTKWNIRVGKYFLLTHEINSILFISVVVWTKHFWRIKRQTQFPRNHRNERSMMVFFGESDLLLVVRIIYAVQINSTFNTRLNVEKIRKPNK